MPIYVYKCPGCGKEEELYLRINEEPMPEDLICTNNQCDEPKLMEKVITAHKGYSINGDNSASVRPKGAGCK